MFRASELVIASWPLQDLANNRSGDVELAELVRGLLPWVPAVLIDGTPTPWGPIIRGDELPDYAEPGQLVDLEQIQLFHEVTVGDMAKTPRDSAPLTYCALDGLADRYKKSTCIRPVDLLPPELLAAISEKFENVRLIGSEDRTRLNTLLSVPYPTIGDFNPLGLVLTEPPPVPYSASEMDAGQLASVIATGEPEFHFPAPPDTVEILLVVPIDEQGRTLGGEIPTDLWQTFVNAPEEPDYLHEMLGIADTFCFRYDRPFIRAARHHLGRIDRRLLEHLPDEAISGYCAGNCIEEQRFMKDWIQFEELNTPAGRMFAQERLRQIEPFTAVDQTPWMLIKHRHLPSLQDVIWSLEDSGIEVDEEEGRLQAVRRAYSQAVFVKQVLAPREIDRFWGFRPLMWQQLWSPRAGSRTRSG